MSMIITGLRQMPKMIDHAGRQKRFTILVPRDSPRVAGPFGEQLKLASPGMDSKERTGKLPTGMFLIEVWIVGCVFDVAIIKDTIESVKPTIRSPSE